MVRSANYIFPIALGLALAWQGLLAEAQLIPVPVDPTLAQPESAAEPASQGESNSDDSSIAIQGEALQAIDHEPSDEMSEGEGEVEEVEVIIERFPNGAVKIEREVVQDPEGNYINHGAWEMWDQRGTPVAQGEFDENMRSGTWIRWFRRTGEVPLLTRAPYNQFSPPFISQGTFKDDQLDGTWTIYDGQKNKISQWEFVQGQRHGLCTWWYPGGRKMREVQYRDGEKDGDLVEWNSDGSIALKESYQYGRKLEGKVATHPNGKKKHEGLQLQSKETEQTPDDWWNLAPQVMTKQGKEEKHGKWTTWYSNGQKQQEGTFEHDLQQGQFTWWHQNGQKSLEGKFENGKQQGLWNWWYPSGQKSIKGEYGTGAPTGRWTWWKEDGKVAQSADLTNSEGLLVDTQSPADPLSPPQPLKHSARPQPRR